MLLLHSKHFYFPLLATHGLYLFNMHEVGKNKRFLSQQVTTQAFGSAAFLHRLRYDSLSLI